ncbi:MAG: hypothetical protein HC780_18355 [Leptolyngbyaceae cyanobacterium CSU_1_3]|nr:hypothetical protein [Leptolyngbyaceae cyanobacterium CSU_1_3]
MEELASVGYTRAMNLSPQQMHKHCLEPTRPKFVGTDFTINLPDNFGDTYARPKFV